MIRLGTAGEEMVHRLLSECGLLGIGWHLAQVNHQPHRLLDRKFLHPIQNERLGVSIKVFFMKRRGIDRIEQLVDLPQGDLDAVGLRGKSNLFFSTLSGGQQQRVLIARALLLNPTLLLLDEPTAGVDMLAEGEIMDLLKKLNSEKGITIILVSHKFHRVQRIID